MKLIAFQEKGGCSHLVRTSERVNSENVCARLRQGLGARAVLQKAMRKLLIKKAAERWDMSHRTEHLLSQKFPGLRHSCQEDKRK